ncbi:hypothetical protein [Acinetobacter sp. CFCC 10889]|uniref:hypothetical protein n=1 Tax=Acinetobacter sp. CFCC 10889 TaxID=1775557 RepID=UPI000DCFD17B|nr:hypothetical protein [Acinetobacter sp. CFCC 10889]
MTTHNAGSVISKELSCFDRSLIIALVSSNARASVISGFIFSSIFMNVLRTMLVQSLNFIISGKVWIFKKKTHTGWVMEFVMNNETIKKVLEEARHELTTLHNLTVTDNIESGVTWIVDTSNILKLLDTALKELVDTEEKVELISFHIKAFSTESFKNKLVSELVNFTTNRRD